MNTKFREYSLQRVAQKYLPFFPQSNLTFKIYHTESESSWSQNWWLCSPFLEVQFHQFFEHELSYSVRYIFWKSNWFGEKTVNTFVPPFTLQNETFILLKWEFLHYTPKWEFSLYSKMKLLYSKMRILIILQNEFSHFGI